MSTDRASRDKAMVTLKRSGMWDEFCCLRESLKADGLDVESARDRAMAELLPAAELALENAPHVGALVEGSTDDVEHSQEPPPAFSGQVGGIVNKPSDIKTDAQLKRFMSREADVVAQITWVAKHLDIDPDMIRYETIPCPEAWGMLQSYAADESRKQEFWAKIYPKLIPSRAQLEAVGKATVDGAQVLRAIEVIQKIRRSVVRS